ncbi:MAG: AMP-binding protein [Trueperaceae bacterium]|nr:AMP-binding protein [Trueperaceae bacterium]
MQPFRTLQELVGGLEGDAPALVKLEEETISRLSYDDLAAQAEQFARGLRARGVGVGDPVAIFAANRPAWFISMLAVLRAGATVVPFDAQLSGDELAHVIEDSGVGWAICDAERLDKLRAHGADVEVIRIDLESTDESDDPEPGTPWLELFQDASPDGDDLPEATPENIAAIFYTSGTTGMPKGVPLSHHNLSAQLRMLIDTELVTNDDRLVLPLPLHHVYPFVVGTLLPFSVGAAVIVPYSLTGPELLRALREGEATIMVGVPRLYEALYNGLTQQLASQGFPVGTLLQGALALSTFIRRRFGPRLGKRLLAPLHQKIGPQMNLAASGGSQLDAELAWKLEGLGWRVAIGYGLSETSPILTIKWPDNPKFGSVGKPVKNIEVKIDESISGRGGEVLVKGPHVFSGYHNLPEQTDSSFSDGWFRTGDLGSFDADGDLTLHGRASTLIVLPGGENVQPDRLEARYAEHPVIGEIGILERNDRLVAVIVPDVQEARESATHISTTRWLKQAIHEAVQEQAKGLPSYQRLSDYAISRQSLPRTRLGKIRRHLLEERYDEAGQDKERGEPVPIGEMSSEDQQLLRDDAAKATWELLAKRYPDIRLTPDSHLQLDLGVDSLEWVDLTLSILQRSGVELSEEEVGRLETVRDLLEAVAEAEEETPQQREARRALLDDPEAALSEEKKRWLEPLTPTKRLISRVVHTLLRRLVRGYFRFEVRGLDNVPSEGPFVVTPNHLSYLDGPLVSAALEYRHLRNLYWAASEDAAFGDPVRSYFSRLAQALPVNTDRAAFSSLAFGGSVLQRGHNLVWFPEGQRSPTGSLQPLKPGIGRLLDHLEKQHPKSIQVVPVHIEGSQWAMPPGTAIPRPTPISITFGKPQSAASLRDEGEGDEGFERITDGLEKRLRDLAQRDPGPVYNR